MISLCESYHFPPKLKERYLNKALTFASFDDDDDDDYDDDDGHVRPTDRGH